MANEVRLIDANALMKVIGEHDYPLVDKYNSVGFGMYTIGIQQAVDEAPTIDPETLRPKGRWEMRGGKRYCTNCGKRACVTRDADDFWYTVGTDFCPNCGADMREG